MSLPPLPPQRVLDRHLPTGIALYGYSADDMQAYGDAAAAAERAHLLADLRTLHEQQGGRHNYYAYAAELLSGKP